MTPIILTLLAQPQSLWFSRRKKVGLPLTLLFSSLLLAGQFLKQQENIRINAELDHRSAHVQANLRTLLYKYQKLAEQLADLSNDFTADISTLTRFTHTNIRHSLLPVRAIAYQPPTADYLHWLDLAENHENKSKLNSQELNRLKLIVDQPGLQNQLNFVAMPADSDKHTIKTFISIPVFKHPPQPDSKSKANQGRIIIYFDLNDSIDALQMSQNQLLLSLKFSGYTLFDKHSNATSKVIQNRKIIDKYLPVAGQTWHLQFIPAADFWSSQSDWLGWWVLFSGLILISLTSITLLIITGKSEHIDEQVQLQTHYLNQQIELRRQLESELSIRNEILEMINASCEIEKIISRILQSFQTSYANAFICFSPSDSTQLSSNAIHAIHVPEISAFGHDHCHFQQRHAADQTRPQVIIDDIKQIDTEHTLHSNSVVSFWSQAIVSSKQRYLGNINLYHPFFTQVSEHDLQNLVYSSELISNAIEHYLAEQELLIAATTFQSHDAVIITDDQGIILRVNKAFCKISGYHADEVINKPCKILDIKQQNEALFLKISQHLLEKGHWEGEIDAYTQNSQPLLAEFTISAIRSHGQITHFVAIFSDISQRKAHEKTIEQLAFYDALTNLANRRLLLDRLDQAIINAEQNNRQGALIYLDLDHFKRVNDKQGHHVGDQLLQITAKRIQQVIHKEDTASRLGGDEFVILLTRLSNKLEEAIEHSATIAERIREQINMPIELDDKTQSFSTSVGVTLFPAQNQQLTSHQLLEQADTAMYHAKKGGRNKIRFYDNKMQEEYQRISNMEVQLKKAWHEQQLLVVYQGQHDLNHQLISAEALLRWQHPQYGLISLSEYLFIAEENYLIIDIGEWVLHQVCRQLKKWQADGFRPDHIAVNISARQFRHEHFVQQVLSAIEASGIAPHQLMIELTETVLIENIADTIDKMNQIKAMGVNIAIDDFGTGYSSLAYLQKLPISQLKIDRSFIQDLDTNPQAKIIVEAIIALAQKLNLEIIAEGVETQQQLQFLTQQKCTLFQGHIFSYPLTPNQFYQDHHVVKEQT